MASLDYYVFAHILYFKDCKKKKEDVLAEANHLAPLYFKEYRLIDKGEQLVLKVKYLEKNKMKEFIDKLEVIL
jgi:hypothetical protein